jgi:ParB-like chromosome segregation protein Spo0J
METNVVTLRLDQIAVDQSLFSRQDFQRDLTPLVNSIEAEGLLEPIEVVPDGNGRYRIVEGNGRYWAHVRLGRESIQARVLDSATVAGAIVRNTQRTEFDEMTLYKAARALLAEQPHLSWQDMGRLLNQDRAMARKYLRLAQATGELHAAVEADPQALDGIQLAVAREIAFKEPDEQRQLVRCIEVEQYRLGRRLKRQEYYDLVNGPKQADTAPLVETAARLTAWAGEDVLLRQSEGRGDVCRLVVETRSAQRLADLVEHLGRISQEETTEEATQ